MISCENARQASRARHSFTVIPRNPPPRFDMHPARSTAPFSIPLWLVWLVAGVAVLIGLGSHGLLNNNEGLYAEIPREMIASHDWRHWIIPHLNGLPYMEKPPLLYWLTALGFLLFGASEWSARLVPALSSLACVAMLLWFGTQVQRQQAGRLAALIFVTGTGVFAMSRVLMFDMLLTALLSAALLLAYRYAIERRPRFLLWSYVFLALAVLAKGFVALILFGLVVVAFDLTGARSVREFWRGLSKWFEWRALALFALVAVPWHVAASLTEPSFAWFYFINEHVLRFLGRREPHDYYAGPWWYYLPRMAIYLFPWSFLLPCLLARRGKRTVQTTPGLSRFLWIAWLLPLGFFSISSAKANYYLVVVMPFAALHLALAIADRDFLSPRMRALPGLLIAGIATALGVGLLLRQPEPESALRFLGLSQQHFVLTMLMALALLAFASALLAWRSVRIGILSYLTLPALVMAGLTIAVVPLEPQISTRTLAQYLQEKIAQGQAPRHIYLYRDFEQLSSLAFYLKQTVPVVDAHSADLFWGDKLRPANASTLTSLQFEKLLSQQKVALVVRDRELADFRATRFFGRFTAQKQIGNTTVYFN